MLLGVCVGEGGAQVSDIGPAWSSCIKNKLILRALIQKWRDLLNFVKNWELLPTLLANSSTLSIG